MGVALRKGKVLFLGIEAFRDVPIEIAENGVDKRGVGGGFLLG